MTARKPGMLAALPLRRTVPWMLAIAAAVLALHEGWQLVRALRFNAVIAEPASIEPVSHEIAPALLFAHAHRAAEAGRRQDALALYTAAARDPRIAPAAYYNSGNLYLREALALAERGALAQTPQPVELAKRLFREALRADPGQWAAKYNLERALRLAPELDEDDSPPPPPQQSERAVTTMRGFTLGLP